MSSLKGKIILIEETQTFDSGFRKREFVIETDEQYPQKVKFESTQDRVALLDACKVGESIEVFYNIRGNEYNGKYYVNLQAWRIDAVSESDNTPQAEPMAQEEGDLPF